MVPPKPLPDTDGDVKVIREVDKLNDDSLTARYNSKALNMIFSCID